MIRHCVMFKWNDGVSEGVRSEIFSELDRLATLNCVAGYHHGPDAGLVDGNWDYAVVGDFESADNYAEYATEAGHVALINDLIKPNIAARAGIQFTI